MTEYKLREEICEIGRRLYNKGFAAANDGNITIRLNDREVLCTPTMVSKGFMKPEDICKVDYEGKQLAGTRKRTSEVLLHLAVYKTRPDVNAVVHCHPPHATAFAVAQEPIPKCILPEVEVFLGEVPMARYETPGTHKFAETIIPYVKDCNTIILANHGTATFRPNLESAYFNSEIIDAYCRILILARQLGRVNYFTEAQVRELLDLKKRLGYDDPRFDTDSSGQNTTQRGHRNHELEANAFEREEGGSCANPNGKAAAALDVERLAQAITERVMAAVTSIKS